MLETVRTLVESLPERARALWEQALDIWLDGGWAMYVLAVVGLVIFGLGVHLQVEFRRKGFLRVPEPVWRRWLKKPAERRGPIGLLLDEVSVADTLEELRRRFERLRATELAPFARDLRVMRICVSAAPLVGLLGTVTGMLATFAALAAGSGGDETMQLVASGISEALVTTETGLVLALPGLFFQYQLARKYERYRAFLAHLEVVVSQAIHQGSHASLQPRRNGHGPLVPPPAVAPPIRAPHAATHFVPAPTHA